MISRAAKILGFLNITEMSFEKKRALKRLDNLSDVVCEHLLKAFLYPGSRDRNGWLKELNTWRRKLVMFRRSKNGKHNFNKKELIQYLWEEPFGEIGDTKLWVAYLVQDGHPPAELDRERFVKYVYQYIDSILTDTQFGG